MKEAVVRAAMKKEAASTKGAAVGIPPRRMAFPLPTHGLKYPFFHQNAFACSLFAVFSAIFPPGERFFVESVRHFRHHISDPTLKAQVSGFIGQESFHGQEHEHLNQWFEDNGYDIAMADRMIRFSLGLLEKLPPSQQIACTSFMEHFTALLAEQWLTHEEFRNTSHPDMLKLWTWHALEELEHKAVAFDVHTATSQHAWRERMLAGPLVLTALLPGIAFSLLWITAKQDQRFNVREHKRGWIALMGKRGFLRPIFRQLPEYATRRHHPSDHDTRALEKEWRERLFGEQGELNHYWKNAAN